MWARLPAVKQAFDPGDVFRFGHARGTAGVAARATDGVGEVSLPAPRATE